VRNRLAGALSKAAKSAGLDGTTSHALRHHFASLLIAGGCSVKSVQTRLGHASAVETLQVCAHLWGDDDDVTRAAVERAWEADGETSTRTSRGLSES
jgi:site-specific recombinase XerD